MTISSTSTFTFSLAEANFNRETRTIERSEEIVTVAKEISDIILNPAKSKVTIETGFSVSVPQGYNRWTSKFDTKMTITGTDSSSLLSALHALSGVYDLHEVDFTAYEQGVEVQSDYELADNHIVYSNCNNNIKVAKVSNFCGCLFNIGQLLFANEDFVVPVEVLLTTTLSDGKKMRTLQKDGCEIANVTVTAHGFSIVLLLDTVEEDFNRFYKGEKRIRPGHSYGELMVLVENAVIPRVVLSMPNYTENRNKLIQEGKLPQDALLNTLDVTTVTWVREFLFHVFNGTYTLRLIGKRSFINYYRCFALFMNGFFDVDHVITYVEVGELVVEIEDQKTETKVNATCATASVKVRASRMQHATRQEKAKVLA